MKISEFFRHCAAHQELGCVGWAMKFDMPHEYSAPWVKYIKLTEPDWNEPGNEVERTLRAIRRHNALRYCLAASIAESEGL